MYRICIFLCLITTACFAAQPVQTEYYPIIFVHGHSGDASVEDTWDWMIQNKLSNQGFDVYGHIWADTVLPSNLSPRTIFTAGVFRRNGSDSIGARIGKIGAIPLTRADVTSMKDDELTVYLSTLPPYFNLQTRRVEYVNSYFDSARESYAVRLKEVVDNVLVSTGAKKVILVAHSMGGLVCRAYIKWLGGDKTVFKILTIGSPNHGIANDGRAMLEQLGNKSSWQFGGHYLEMSANANFNGKSYTDWLNDGWESQCKAAGVQYATIAGNYNPWNFGIRIGNDSDGVIDSGSARLDGAVFNAKSETAHTHELPPMISTSVEDERNILRSTYTSEIIKRWVFYNQVDTMNATDLDLSATAIGPAPFSEWAVVQVVGVHPSKRPVCVTVYVTNHLGQKVFYKSSPLYQGMNHNPLQFEQIANFLAYIDVYDMNGKIQTVRKYPFMNGYIGNYGQWGASNTLFLDSSPQRVSDSNTATFRVHTSDPNPNVRYAYQVDNEPQTEFSALANNTLQLKGLFPGLHRIYIRARLYAKPDPSFIEKSIEYYWISGNQTDILIDGQTITDTRRYNASNTITVQNSIFKSSSQVNIDAGNRVLLQPGFRTELGASCNIKAK